MKKKIRLVLVDDHKLFRDGMKKILDLEPDCLVVGEALDGFEALDLIRELRPDVVLLDVGMPGLSGVDVIRELNETLQDIKYVAITAFHDEQTLSDLSSVGVHGFVLKSSGRLELLSAIRAVARGQLYVDPKVAGLLLGALHKKQDESSQLQDLTSREREVLYWLARGLSNAEISGQMVLSEKTVKNHVSHVLKKLDLRDRTQAAILAWRIGLVRGDPPSQP